VISIGHTLPFEFHAPFLEFDQNLRSFLKLRERPELIVDVLPVQLAGLADEDAFDIEPIASACANAFMTIRSSAEQVRIRTPPGRSNKLECDTADSSNGSAPSAISIPTPDLDCSSKTLWMRANPAASGILPSNFPSNF